MTTAFDLLTRSLKNAGVVGTGQTALAEDMNDALAECNEMLSQWQRKRWMIWHLVDTAKVSTGAQSYTVGNGQDLDVARPDKIEGAYFRQLNTAPNPVDYPLTLIHAMEDYARITIKKLTSFSQYLFYDAAMPIGLVYPWPVLEGALYELHILTKEVLGQINSLTQVLQFPAEYSAAIRYNLAIRLRVNYQIPPPQGPDMLPILARDSLSVIKNANVTLPLLHMPRGLVRNGVYNIFSDQTR